MTKRRILLAVSAGEENIAKTIFSDAKRPRVKRGPLGKRCLFGCFRRALFLSHAKKRKSRKQSQRAESRRAPATAAASLRRGVVFGYSHRARGGNSVVAIKRCCYDRFPYCCRSYFAICIDRCNFWIVTRPVDFALAGTTV